MEKSSQGADQLQHDNGTIDHEKETSKGKQ